MQNNLYLYPNLVKVRKQNMTQNELAKQIGISQQEISRYEKGEIKAPINYIIDLAECCNVSVDYILGRENKNNDCEYNELTKIYNMLSQENKIRAIERMKTLLELQNNEA
ncbi:MAG: helix-turn-helix domain-containing protein [Oscillospiraceae bacterium]